MASLTCGRLTVMKKLIAAGIHPKNATVNRVGNRVVTIQVISSPEKILTFLGTLGTITCSVCPLPNSKVSLLLDCDFAFEDISPEEKLIIPELLKNLNNLPQLTNLS